MSVTEPIQRKSEKIAMLRKKSFKQAGVALGGLALLAAATGCQDMTQNGPTPEAQRFPPIQNVNQGTPAGLPVGVASTDKVLTLIASTKTNPRGDIFAMSHDERLFDIKATNERIFATTGQFFGPSFVPRTETVVVDTVEPQPFRRLAGVLVGDSVMAIIDMGPGTQTQVIRPGMQIPNSPWKVISIDEEKAILRREGNKRPREIIVRLQGPQSAGGGNFVPQAPVRNPANPGGQQPPRARPGGGRVGGAAGGID